MGAWFSGCTENKV